MTKLHADIVRLSRQGMRPREVARQLFVCERTVQRVRKAHGIAPLVQRGTWTEDDLSKAEMLLADGNSVAEASRVTGISEKTLHRRFPKMGWTAQQSGAYARSVAIARKNG